MDALKIFVEQIETFGTFMYEQRDICYQNQGYKQYRIDDITIAIIYYNENNDPYRAEFVYH